jgi:hypothetical protein
MGINRLFKPRFLGLTLRYQNAVAEHAWFSFTHIYTDFILSFCNNNPWSLE